jgi:predicted ATP-grasp superfamily ATP-dependent carboligase
MSNVTIEDVSRIKKKKYTVLLGFAGSGFVGNTALMYIARNSKLKHVANVKSKFIPPMVLMVHGSPIYPFRVYADEEKNLLFVVSESVIPPEHSWIICDGLMDWLLSKGAIEFISFEGIPLGGVAEKVQAFGFSLGDRNLAQHGIQLTSEGAISGLSACLMQECMERKSNLDWSSIFIPTMVVNNVDYDGSVAVVEILNLMFSLEVDPSLLQQSANMIRRSMRSSQTQGRRQGLMGRLMNR